MNRFKKVEELFQEVLQISSIIYSKKEKIPQNHLNIHYNNGKKIIKLLEDNIKFLEPSELKILAYAYNWTDQHKKAVSISLKYLITTPSLEASIHHEVYVSNLYPDTTYFSKEPYIKMIALYSSYIKSNIGSKIIWLLLISYLHIELAYLDEGTYSDSIPNTTKVYHPNELVTASKYLTQALQTDFDSVINLNSNNNDNFSYNWLEGLYKLSEYKHFQIPNLLKDNYK